MKDEEITSKYRVKQGGIPTNVGKLSLPTLHGYISW